MGLYLSVTEGTAPNTDYTRYWHGGAFFIRLLHLFTDVSGIKLVGFTSVLLPLILVMAARAKEGRFTSFRESLLLIIRCGLCWDLAYAGAFLVKWTAATLVTGENAFTLAITLATERVGGAATGSRDGSPDFARAHGARVVEVLRKGYGAAVMGGIAAAEGTYVIMGDADGSYDFAHLDLFVETLRGFDQEKALALDLRCPGMEFATELIARFAQSGAQIAEVPTPLRRDKRGRRGHLRTVRDGLRHLYFIVFQQPFS